MASENNFSAVQGKLSPYMSKVSRSGTDAIIIITLYIYFSAYPFIFRNFATLFNSVALNISLVLVGFTLLISAHRMVIPKPILRHPMLKVGVLFYVAYFIVLIMVSLFHSVDSVVGKAAIIKMRDFLFVVVVIFFLTKKGIQNMIRVYVTLLTWFSILGLLLVLLIYLGLLHPLAEISLDNLAGGAVNKRLFYGIGFVWPHTWIGSIFGLERLQSFADEAGTFAFALTPAILFAANWGMRVRVAIMLTALIFTFSVGAILVWILIVTFYFVSRNDRKRIWGWGMVLLIFCLTIFLLASSFHFLDLLNLGNSYLSSKYSNEGNMTSVGQRLSDLQILIAKIQEHPWGFGAGSTGVSLGRDVALAIGWFIPLAEAGLLGWLLYLVAFGFILWHAVGDVFCSTSDVRIAALIVVVNGYAAFQRAGIDSNVWQMFWLITYFRFTATATQRRFT